MKNRYYISSGRLNKLYTLRTSFTEPSGHTYVERDYHVSTLTADRETSIAKAQEILGSLGHSANLDIDFDLEKITRGDDKDWSIFQSGKYNGKSIHEVLELDKGYLIFACEKLANYSQYKKTVELAKSLIGRELKDRHDVRENEKEAFHDKVQERIPLLQELSAVAYYYFRNRPPTAYGGYSRFPKRNLELFYAILERGEDWLYGCGYEENGFAESIHSKLSWGENLSERQVDALFNYIASVTTKKNTDARNAEVENLRATYGHLFAKEEQK